MSTTITTNFGKIWPAHVSSLTQFLLACRSHFDGDMDLFLVLSVIGDRTFSQRHAPSGIGFDQWQNDGQSHVPVENINLQSLSDFSGIPRETVRRKLNTLIRKGWVVRDENGFYAATEKAKHDLVPLTQESISYLARMKAVFDSI